jgi:integrase
MLFAGLRAEEVGGLRWRDVDLANGRLKIGRTKTDTGMREVDILPVLRDELAALKASAIAGPDDPVFVTSTGHVRSRHNLRQ